MVGFSYYIGNSYLYNLMYNKEMMKQLNYWAVLLIVALLVPASTTQAKGKKEKAKQEVTTGAQDREQWVKWLWKISYH